MATYKPLQSLVLTAAPSSVTFSGIDQGYTDLVLVCNFGEEPTNASYGLYLQFNGDTGTNYSSTNLLGNGTTASSSRASTASFFRISGYGTGTANTLTNIAIANIMDYANSTTHKTTISRSSIASLQAGASVGLWRSTSAITSITITAESQNLSAGSTFDLYGIKSGAPQAFGGDVVATDGTYWYHAFKTTGVFTPLKTLSADVLVVAGGGGGGGGGTNFGGGGGGGAGGLLGFASQSISTATTITVGGGGAGGTSAGTVGTVGVDSRFGSTTLVKGGGYGATYLSPYTGGTGGSGGGGSYTGAGGSPTSGQGNAGSVGTGSGSYWGGAGGGAGSAATNASGATAPTAGAGTNTNATYGSFAATVSATATGVSGYFAGGGGGGNGLNATGGTGGSGGGGNAGAAASSGSAGTANSGGGGGGCSINSAGTNGGAGGSGIVIVRYPV
jgi:hypothetical protein